MAPLPPDLRFEPPAAVLSDAGAFPAFPAPPAFPPTGLRDGVWTMVFRTFGLVTILSVYRVMRRINQLDGRARLSGTVFASPIVVVFCAIDWVYEVGGDVNTRGGWVSRRAGVAAKPGTRY